jgi:hypothetical protein
MTKASLRATEVAGKGGAASFTRRRNVEWVSTGVENTRKSGGWLVVIKREASADIAALVAVPWRAGGVSVHFPVSTFITFITPSENKQINDGTLTLV